VQERRYNVITVAFAPRCPRIEITNDKTYEEVVIECRDYDEEQKLAIELITVLLNREE
jgi:hypothetical protein